jgi:hypothetical protein
MLSAVRFAQLGFEVDPNPYPELAAALRVGGAMERLGRMSGALRSTFARKRSSASWLTLSLRSARHVRHARRRACSQTPRDARRNRARERIVALTGARVVR